MADKGGLTGFTPSQTAIDKALRNAYNGVAPSPQAVKQLDGAGYDANAAVDFYQRFASDPQAVSNAGTWTKFGGLHNWDAIQVRTILDGGEPSAPVDRAAQDARAKAASAAADAAAQANPAAPVTAGSLAELWVAFNDLKARVDAALPLEGAPSGGGQG